MDDQSAFTRITYFQGVNAGTTNDGIVTSVADPAETPDIGEDAPALFTPVEPFPFMS